jgi:hypothetical protein
MQTCQRKKPRRQQSAQGTGCARHRVRKAQSAQGTGCARHRVRKAQGAQGTECARDRGRGARAKGCRRRCAGAATQGSRGGGGGAHGGDTGAEWRGAGWGEAHAGAPHLAHGHQRGEGAQALAPCLQRHVDEAQAGDARLLVLRPHVRQRRQPGQEAGQGRHAVRHVGVQVARGGDGHRGGGGGRVFAAGCGARAKHGARRECGRGACAQGCACACGRGAQATGGGGGGGGPPRHVWAAKGQSPVTAARAGRHRSVSAQRRHAPTGPTVSTVGRAALPAPPAGATTVSPAPGALTASGTASAADAGADSTSPAATSSPASRLSSDTRENTFMICARRRRVPWTKVTLQAGRWWWGGGWGVGGGGRRPRELQRCTHACLPAHPGPDWGLGSPTLAKTTAACKTTSQHARTPAPPVGGAWASRRAGSCTGRPADQPHPPPATACPTRTMCDSVASAMRAMRWDAWGSREMRKQHWHMFHTSSSVSRWPAPQRMQLPTTSSSFISVASSSCALLDSKRHWEASGTKRGGCVGVGQGFQKHARALQPALQTATADGQRATTGSYVGETEAAHGRHRAEEGPGREGGVEEKSEGGGGARRADDRPLLAGRAPFAPPSTLAPAPTAHHMHGGGHALGAGVWECGSVRLGGGGCSHLRARLRNGDDRLAGPREVRVNVPEQQELVNGRQGHRGEWPTARTFARE